MDFKEAPNLEELPANAKTLVIEKQGKEALQDVAFGSIAGVLGKYIEYPFDTVKVRLQSQPYGVQLYNGPLDCLHQSITKNGFLSLYRGISAPLFGAAIETSSLFFSYRVAQNALQAAYYKDVETLPINALVLSGAASGAFTSILLTPIELIKCKMQVPLSSASGVVRQPGPWTLIKTVFKHQGVLGFWHGQMGTLIRETGGSAAWFGSFESVSLAFRNAQPKGMQDTTLPLWQQLLAGATAGMTYNFVFYPADTIKSRMQTEDVSKAAGAKQNSFWGVGKALWKDQGLRGLYRGCGITVCRAAPSSAVIFTIYESLKRAFA